MPLYKRLTIDSNTKVLIWSIQESYTDLADGITLTTANQTRVDSMKSELHQRGFLSIRHLLKEVGLVDADLIYVQFLIFYRAAFQYQFQQEPQKL